MARNSIETIQKTLDLAGQELGILHQISQSISCTLDLDQVLSQIIDLVIDVTRGDSCLLYLLDEPEAALSPSRQLSVITRIHDLVQQKSQFIIATHSPILMAYPEAYIYSFSAKGIEKIEHKHTEHYRITRDFLANPQRMLKYLLEP